MQANYKDLCLKDFYKAKKIKNFYKKTIVEMQIKINLLHLQIFLNSEIKNHKTTLILKFLILNIFYII